MRHNVYISTLLPNVSIVPSPPLYLSSCAYATFHCLFRSSLLLPPSQNLQNTSSFNPTPPFPCRIFPPLPAVSYPPCSCVCCRPIARASSSVCILSPEIPPLPPSSKNLRFLCHPDICILVRPVHRHHISVTPESLHSFAVPCPTVSLPFLRPPPPSISSCNIF